LRPILAFVLGRSLPCLGNIFTRGFSGRLIGYISLRVSSAASPAPTTALWSAFLLELSRGVAFDLRLIGVLRFEAFLPGFAELHRFGAGLYFLYVARGRSRRRLLLRRRRRRGVLYFSWLRGESQLLS
jgi:hypothetical protein